MNDRFAVMDLGTNTFHLLIADRVPSGFKEILREEEAVKLGEGGINKAAILRAPFERGVKTVQRFAAVIKENEALQVKAIATSALRNAANGTDFTRDVKEKTGIDIEIITGDKEAGFIYRGVKASGCLSTQNSLIVDIGGGSVEFIICNDNGIFWKQSFEMGAARLMDKFHHDDPIPPASILALNNYLEDTLKSLFIAVEQHPVKNLVGSSGIFESYAGLIANSKGNTFDLKNTICFEFDKKDLLMSVNEIVFSTRQQRLKNPGIIPVRKDMIVTASLLARFIIEKLEFERVMMTTYSLKEGVLTEMMG